MAELNWRAQDVGTIASFLTAAECDEYIRFGESNGVGLLPHRCKRLHRPAPVWPEALWSGVTLMLWTIFAILLILWLLGWGFHVAGSLIHLLLVLAVIVAVINLVTGRRAV